MVKRSLSTNEVRFKDRRVIYSSVGKLIYKAL